MQVWARRKTQHEMQTEMRLAKLQCFPYRQGRPQVNAIDVAVLGHGVNRNF